jgi:hypothetical protein
MSVTAASAEPMGSGMRSSESSMNADAKTPKKMMMKKKHGMSDGMGMKQMQLLWPRHRKVARPF